MRKREMEKVKKDMDKIIHAERQFAKGKATKEELELLVYTPKYIRLYARNHVKNNP